MNYFQPHFLLLYFIRVTNARGPSSAANSNQISNIQSFDCNSNLALGNVSTSPEKLLSSALQSDTDTMFSHMRMVLAKIGKLYSSLFKKYLTVTVLKE